MSNNFDYRRNYIKLMNLWYLNKEIPVGMALLEQIPVEVGDAGQTT